LNAHQVGEKQRSATRVSFSLSPKDGQPTGNRQDSKILFYYRLITHSTIRQHSTNWHSYDNRPSLARNIKITKHIAATPPLPSTNDRPGDTQIASCLIETIWTSAFWGQSFQVRSTIMAHHRIQSTFWNMTT